MGFSLLFTFSMKFPSKNINLPLMANAWLTNNVDNITVVHAIFGVNYEWNFRIILIFEGRRWELVSKVHVFDNILSAGGIDMGSFNPYLSSQRNLWENLRFFHVTKSWNRLSNLYFMFSLITTSFAQKLSDLGARSHYIR